MSLADTKTHYMTMVKKQLIGSEAYVAPDCRTLCTLPGGVLCESQAATGTGSIQDWEDGVSFNF